MAGINLPPDILITIIRDTLARHDEVYPPDADSRWTFDSLSESAHRNERIPPHAMAFLGWAAATLSEWLGKVELIERAEDMRAELATIAEIVGRYRKSDNAQDDGVEE